MDCKTARRLLDFAGLARSELDASDSGALEEHLKVCPECGCLAEADKRFDNAIGPIMNDIPIPEGLGLRVMKRLNADRDKYYRGVLLRVCAVAAVLVLVIGLSWWRIQSWRTDIPVEHVRQEAHQRYEVTDDRKKKALVDRWLTAQSPQGLVAPSEFNYKLLDTWQMAEIPGTRIRVPLLRFRSGDFGGPPSAADVYILSDRQVNFQSLDQPEDIVSGIYDTPRVKLIPSRENEHIRYLVMIYTRTELDTFLKKPSNVR